MGKYKYIPHNRKVFEVIIRCKITLSKLIICHLAVKQNQNPKKKRYQIPIKTMQFKTGYKNDIILYTM